MTTPQSDIARGFNADVARLYESHLVPMIFAPYAEDLARRVAAAKPRDVLEIAAGTGAVTRALAAQLPSDARIVATDLNPTMLEQATAAGVPGEAGRVEWRQANAMQLPFGDASFDVATCQFGVMFFPDKPVAFAEARRVLRPGGSFIFNVWDGIEVNVFAECVEDAMAHVFPEDPPLFMRRLPHGYHDQATIARDLAEAGFTAAPEFTTMRVMGRAPSPRHAAIAFCQGTPLRNEIAARDASRLDEATDAAERALAQRFGSGEIEGVISATIVALAEHARDRSN